MNSLVIGIGDCQASATALPVWSPMRSDPAWDSRLFNPQTSVGGLLHILLPDAAWIARRPNNPFLFADTGMPALLDRCRRLGAAPSRLRIWLAGGSAVMDDRGIFNIGKRNQLAIRKALWKAGLMAHAEDLGGSGSRTVRLELATGTFWVRAAGGIEQELRCHGPRTLGGTACR